MRHHLVYARGGDEGGFDGFAPGGFFIQHRHIHIAVRGKGKAARNWRGSHHQHIGGLAFCAKLHPLRHAEPVLFIDHGKPQIVEDHVFLKHGMGADENLGITRGEGRKFRLTITAFVAACQQNQRNARRLRQGTEAFVMLAGQNFCGGHQHALPACLDRDQQGLKRDKGFAGAHIALQQAVHAQGCGHIGGYFGNGAGLGGGGRVRQSLQHAGLQGAGGNAGHTFAPAQAGARQG